MSTLGTIDVIHDSAKDYINKDRPGNPGHDHLENLLGVLDKLWVEIHEGIPAETFFLGATGIRFQDIPLFLASISWVMKSPMCRRISLLKLTP